VDRRPFELRTADSAGVDLPSVEAPLGSGATRGWRAIRNRLARASPASLGGREQHV